jgi:peptidoglycan hydrolase-like protein with peptidoglycan-binding domain
MKQGFKGNEIKPFQYLLQVVPDGDFGRKTLEATLNFQKSMNIPQTGEVDRITQNILYRTYGDPPYIKTAREYIGVTELDIDGDGVTDNRGVEVDKFIKHVWSWYDLSDQKKKGIPWCAAFVCYILHKSTHGKFSFKSASAKDTIEYAKKNLIREVNKHSDLRFGEIVIGGWVNRSGFGHVYFVDPLNTLENQSNIKTFTTIEGNTSGVGSREGDGVYQRKRVLNSPSGNKFYAFKI